MRILKFIVPVFIKRWIIYYFLRIKHKIIIGKNARITKSCIFEGFSSIYQHTEVSGSYIGYGTYVANNSVIRKAKIGRFCSIGDNVRTGLGIHPTTGFVSTHPAFFSLNKQSGFTFVDQQRFEEHKYIDDEKKYYVEVGNDVWIGNNVMIKDGITIGDGAIVAAGAIVTKNVPPYAIVGGIPARIIRYRFTEEQREKLLKIKLWDWSMNDLEQSSYYFDNIEVFLNKYGNN